MTEDEIKGYVDTILGLLSNSRKSNSMTTGMAGSFRTLKKRFSILKRFKKCGKVTNVISVIVSVIIVVLSVFSSGVLAKTLLTAGNNVMI